MEKSKAESILREHSIQRSPEDPRTIEQIAEQIVKTGSPKPESLEFLGKTAL